MDLFKGFPLEVREPFNIMRNVIGIGQNLFNQFCFKGDNKENQKKKQKTSEKPIRDAFPSIDSLFLIGDDECLWCGYQESLEKKRFEWRLLTEELNLVSNVIKVAPLSLLVLILLESGELYKVKKKEKGFDDKIIVMKGVKDVCSSHKSAAFLNFEGSVFTINLDEDFKYTKVSFNSNSLIKSISCSDNHFIAIDLSGNVYSWGLGSHGQLGHGDLEGRDHPEKVEALAGIKIKQSACGSWHSLFLSEEGDVYSCGWNFDGQLGISDQSEDISAGLPTCIDFKSHQDVFISQVECGFSHSVALSDKGDAWSWGNNKYGQVGGGSKEKVIDPQIIQSNVTSIHCGPYQTILLLQ